MTIADRSGRSATRGPVSVPSLVLAALLAGSGRWQGRRRNPRGDLAIEWRQADDSIRQEDDNLQTRVPRDVQSHLVLVLRD
jgi:hypothetical protein